VTDTARFFYRYADHRDEKLVAALFIGPEPVILSRDQLAAQLGDGVQQEVLAGQVRSDRPDPGPTVCSCLNVGLNTIRSAIETGRATTVSALGEALGAGISCGSCRPELADLLARFACKVAAE